MLRADMLEPVRPVERRPVAGVGAGRREPVRPFPAAARAIDRAELAERLIERAATDAARRVMFDAGIADRIVLAV
jgi:hypothetical protein